jgi:hypothetical protein
MSSPLGRLMSWPQGSEQLWTSVFRLSETYGDKFISRYKQMATWSLSISIVSVFLIVLIYVVHGRIV